MYLFIDTETNGLPDNYNAPTSNLDNWPRIVQVAWLLCDQEGTILESFETLVKPDGFDIGEESFNIHGISVENAIDSGMDLTEVLLNLRVVCKKASFLVAHNIDFDRKVLDAEYIRIKTPNSLRKLKKLCTMSIGTDFCRIKGRYGDFKWPNLRELYIRVMGYRLYCAHDAMEDVTACKECFFELVEIGAYNTQTHTLVMKKVMELYRERRAIERDDPEYYDTHDPKPYRPHTVAPTEVESSASKWAAQLIKDKEQKALDKSNSAKDTGTGLLILIIISVILYFIMKGCN